MSARSRLTLAWFLADTRYFACAVRNRVEKKHAGRQAGRRTGGQVFNQTPVDDARKVVLK